MRNQRTNAVLIRFAETLTAFERELIAAAAADGADKEAVAEVLRGAGGLKAAIKKAAGETKNTYA